MYIVEHLDLPVDSILVLGAATGEVLRHFDDAWGVMPEGCEISRWAHRRIPEPYRSRIRCTDLRRHLPTLRRAGRRFDLIFSNSLVYLARDEIPGVLADCRAIGDSFHFLSSTSESFEPGDRYRVTLAPRRWWRDRFVEAGFAPTRSPYLFR